VVSEDFEFRSTRNGTRVITRGMADFQSIKSYFDNHSLQYYTFFPKSEEPIKAVIRHLPYTTPAEDISDGLVSLGFDVVSVKQMTSTRRSPPEESKVINLPPFLVTLPRAANSQEIFRLPSLCHIAIRVETYRTQNSLTQCHNCQQFGHFWENCKQPLRSLWCGADTSIKSAPRRATQHPDQHAATAGWRKERNLFPPTIGLQPREGGAPEKEVTKGTQDHNGNGVLFRPHHPWSLFCGGSPRQQRSPASSGTPSSSEESNQT
jgi:hypothetical protein